jgi:16S rRNA (uracil1498-N3)-methyltransferase
MDEREEYGAPGRTVHVFVGPEGGFTSREVEWAGTHGITPVSLGPRVLRAETAGFAAVTAILWECGDMDPVTG